ncbi:MAG: HAD family hydrolase [Candidatus Hydrogenedentes bacterium]|nr:HAD family hydrolase [Candidatus Hydrogenedentota bacterium]
MSRWKALSLDLDGTLLSNDNSISVESLQAIRELNAKGCRIIISTARPLRAVTPILPGWFGSFYWITCNGAWILRDGAVLHRNEIPRAEARRMVETFLQHDLWVQIEADDIYYSDKPPLFGFPADCPPLSAFQSGDACKLLVTISSPNELCKLRALIPDTLSMVVTNGGALAQISRRDCGKLDAVRFVLDSERIDIADLIAFGDDNNDIELIKAAGMGVAMRNATAEVLSVADHVTKSNDDDGVGLFLRDLLANWP